MYSQTGPIIEGKKREKKERNRQELPEDGEHKKEKKRNIHTEKKITDIKTHRQSRKRVHFSTIFWYAFLHDENDDGNASKRDTKYHMQHWNDDTHIHSTNETTTSKY